MKRKRLKKTIVCSWAVLMAVIFFANLYSITQIANDIKILVPAVICLVCEVWFFVFGYVNDWFEKKKRGVRYYDIHIED